MAADNDGDVDATSSERTAVEGERSSFLALDAEGADSETHRLNGKRLLTPRDLTSDPPVVMEAWFPRDPSPDDDGRLSYVFVIKYPEIMNASNNVIEVRTERGLGMRLFHRYVNERADDLDAEVETVPFEDWPGEAR